MGGAFAESRCGFGEEAAVPDGHFPSVTGAFIRAGVDGGRDSQEQNGETYG